MNETARSLLSRVGATGALVVANAVILPGVELGEGCVVGANSLVARSCEPWTIYAGSPAKPIKLRPRERILELEAELRRTLYDESRRYIPKRLRGNASA